ncbi:MAG: hypothetical protein P8O18_03135 [Candidatus Thioglobus sp.]|jgi:hypothetical protein|nr:hypothetical protein [Candidatus Thioglobus sp.]
MKNQLLNSPITFPKNLPEGYQYLEDEPVYDPKKHLALEYPKDSISLHDLGYSAEEISKCPTEFAISGVARLLSNEGSEELMKVIQKLKTFSSSGGSRIQHMLRGCVYRSRFLRDLCLCPEVSSFMSKIYGIPVSPHSIPLHLGHCNFAPDDLNRAVDRWHTDTIGLDYVMIVSDPTKQVGGEFQYYMGTKNEVEKITNKGEKLSEKKIKSPHFPGPGYIVVMQGNMVVHRGAKLKEYFDRITMVNAYVPLEIESDDPSRFSDVKSVDPHQLLFPEWAKHKAWLSRGKLNRLIEELPFTDDTHLIIKELKDAIKDVETAINDLSSNEDGQQNYYVDLDK